MTKSEAAVQELPTDEDRIALPARRGPSVHALGMGRRRSRLALYRQGAPTTTRQAEVLNTAMVGSPSDERGIIIGLDKLSGVMIAHDPITAYQDRRITSPNVIVVGTVGAGKALDVATPIATPSGWAAMGELQVGDHVFDEAGRPTEIVAVSEVRTDRECYAVDFSDGSTVVADAEHLWRTLTRAGLDDAQDLAEVTPVTTQEIRRTVTIDGQPNHWLPDMNAGFRVGATMGAPMKLSPADLLAALNQGNASSGTRWITAVEPVASRPVRCIQVDAASSMYLAGPALIPTHNSSLIKTVYVERPLLLRDRRALVVDKKPGEHGEGEYAPVSRRFGAEPFRFDPDDPDNRTTTCLNLLDPVILAGGGPAAQKQLLFAIAELAGREELDEWHHKALSLAYRATRRAVEVGDIRRPVPVIGDLVERFMDVVGDAALSQARPVVLDRLAMAAASMQFRFERLLEDELAGMFDRETSPHVTLNPKLTVFDVSALPEDGPSTSMVMVAANAWLMGMLTRHRGIRTNFVAEEGWHLLGGPGGRVIQSKSKLSRGLGLSLIAAIHHLTDVPKNSPAIAMIKEAQTVHVFRQDKKDDIDECVAYFNLEESNAAGLSNLDQGEFLLKVGTHREIGVQHVRTPAEMEFTNTDSALTNRPAVAPAEAVKLMKT
ncbi:MAG: hypothetical protein ACR2P2_14855 [Nakamurella sp.]